MKAIKQVLRMDKEPYDLLPKMWQTYLIFGILIVLCFYLSLRAVNKYNFHFTGTEG